MGTPLSRHLRGTLEMSGFVKIPYCLYFRQRQQGKVYTGL